VILAAGTLRPTTIVDLQAGWFWNWNVFSGGWQLLGFVIFVIAAFAETNRLPFDLPEAESELVAGYQVEYSSTPFLLFMIGELVAVVLMCALVSLLFLGGWLSPIPGLPDGIFLDDPENGRRVLLLLDGQGDHATLPL
jgi:NADH-quinone oxidoreductase subunit H